MFLSASQGFVDSVQELLLLNPHADDLKHSIADCKDNLKDAGLPAVTWLPGLIFILGCQGDHLYHHANGLYKERRKQRDILAILETLAVCRPGMHLTANLANGSIL